MDWFKIWKEYIKAVYCHSCLFNFFAEYIMGIAQLDKSQAENKITKRNVNNLRYADDTTLIAESEEKLKSLLMKFIRHSVCHILSLEYISHFHCIIVRDSI